MKMAFSCDDEEAFGLDLEASMLEKETVDIGYAKDEASLLMENSESVKWEDHTDSEVAVSVGFAREYAWNQAKVEIQQARKQIRKLLKLQESETPSFRNLFDLVLGPSSNIGVLLKRTYECSNEDYTRFISTIAAAACYRCSTKQMFMKDSILDTSGLLSEKEYRSFWNAIGCKGTTNLAGPSALGEKPFWMEIEGAFNDTLRKCFILGGGEDSRKSGNEIVIDDHKMHHGCNGKANMACLKRLRHIRDNRFGCVNHHMVKSASGGMVGISWERNNGDTTVSATKRLTQGQYSPMSGTASAPNFSRINFKLDRGYFFEELHYKHFLAGDADVEGTAKRSSMFPFTYDQNLSANDKRELIPTKGSKRLFLKHANIEGKTFTAAAYRNGNGGVTLGYTSQGYGRKLWWDMVPKNEDDLKWYKDPTQLSKKWFSELNGKNEFAQMIINLVDSPMKKTYALTCSCNTPEWFVMRGLTLTSSTTDAIINLCTGNEKDFDTGAWIVIKNYLSCGLQPAVNNDENTPEEAPTNEEPTQNLEGVPGLDPASKDDSDAESNDSDMFRDGAQVILKILEDEDKDLSGKFLHILEDEGEEFYEFDYVTDPAYISKCVKALPGGKATKNYETNLSKLVTWLKLDTASKNFFYLSKKSLETECQKLFGPQGRVWQKSDTKETLYTKLVNNASGFTASEVPELFASNDLEYLIIERVMRSTFMPKLTAKAKEYCKIGHALEEPLAQRLLIDSSQGMTKHKVLEIYKVGLHQMADLPYVGTSIDFLAGAIVDGTKTLVGIECKVRATNKTATKEINNKEDTLILDERYRSACFGPRGAELYSEVDCTSEILSTYVKSKHELVQILHHALVFDLTYVLLLVGNQAGHILRGVWVKFSGNFKSAYKRLLKDIYNAGLMWVYDDTSSLPKEKITAVLGTLKTQMTFESFVEYLAFWRYCRNNMYHPIPVLKGIIPLVMSMWNAFKGGSDTYSKMVWSIMHYPPNESAQAGAISQMILFALINIHRMSQYFTAKEDLNFYSSITHFRKLASKRETLHSTLLKVVSFSREHVSQVVSASEDSNEESVIRTRTTTLIRKVKWAAPKTGAEPMRYISRFFEKTFEELKDKKKEKEWVRKKVCTGLPIYRTYKNGEVMKQHKCCICGKHTRMFCSLCYKWACPPTICQKTKDVKETIFETKEMVKSSTTAKESEMIYGRLSCWHLCHTQGYERLIKQTQNELDNDNYPSQLHEFL